MKRWRERLFASMNRTSMDMGSYFNLPPNQIVEVGQRIEI